MSQLDPISVLLPVLDQKKEFFLAAVESVLRQTSPEWRLLILRDVRVERTRAWAASFADARVGVIDLETPGFAHALNTGLRLAETAFVSILLSDDLLAPNAIETLQARRRRSPEVDYFHSGRRMVNAAGAALSGPLAPQGKVTAEHFLTRGSPVKHLMCWRRDAALAIGGMDESLSVHGCDDYDFPWRMLEAGARFEPVPEVLYLYRRHNDGERLTTGVSLDDQIATLTRMFANHGASAAETAAYLDRACAGYLVRDQLGVEGEAPPYCCYLAGDGYEVYRIQDPGPGGAGLARRMIGLNADDVPLQVRVVADGVDSADLVLRGRRLFVLTLELADAAEGPARRLYDAVLDYAADLGADSVYAPTAALARRHAAGPAVERLPKYRLEREGWWLRIDLAANAGNWARLPKRVRVGAAPSELLRARWV